MKSSVADLKTYKINSSIKWAPAGLRNGPLSFSHRPRLAACYSFVVFARNILLTMLSRLYGPRVTAAVNLPDRPIDLLWSLKIRRTTFLNIIKFADLLTLRLRNWERAGRVSTFIQLGICGGQLRGRLRAENIISERCVVPSLLLPTDLLQFESLKFRRYTNSV